MFFQAFLARLRESPEERYLAQATDLADLERRFLDIEHGRCRFDNHRPILLYETPN
jgi:hypothetical protein